MNAVNNGPAGSRVRKNGNFEAYEALEIPYARLHDSAFYAGNYGGEVSVDVHRIFRNFDADENDPKNYIFAPTDQYLQDIESVGTKIFYRLGAAIEHGYKLGVIPPKDNLKWARIAEHIIRHYTEGWADGFHMDIEYFEIWNEPDLGEPKPTWQGTEEQFNEFFLTVFRHLKGCFPHLKLGGPAYCTPWRDKGIYKRFFDKLKENGLMLDFFSYHIYAKTPEEVREAIMRAEEILAENGLSGMETSLNEWNYIKEWRGEGYMESMYTIKNLKGSSFVASSMCMAQNSPLSMLMYYDARPCLFNGIFGQHYEKLKPYYSFASFAALRCLGTQVACDCGEDHLYALAAKGKNDGAILLTYYDDAGKAGDEKEICLCITRDTDAPARAELYLLDDAHDLSLVRCESISTKKTELYVRLPLYGSYLLKLTAI
jgi:hypothetical protein